MKSRVTIFADDFKLIGNDSNRTIIDKDLENLELWENRWLFQFNIDKCKVLYLKFNYNLKLEYKLNGSIMKESDQEKDLGVFTSGKLLWNDQIGACIHITLNQFAYLIEIPHKLLLSFSAHHFTLV